MKIATRDKVYYEHSRFNQPAINVLPGEEFMVQTELCSGDWLSSIDDVFDPQKAKGPNPTVVIEIVGANPGDVLAIKILDVNPDKVGYTGFDDKANRLAQLIYPKDWGLTAKTVAIEDGFVRWSDNLKLPIAPMIGTIGTAPEFEVLRNDRGGHHGGNMDVNEVGTGNTVYFPIYVPGALLHIGDVHALQGDGEINVGGGIECKAEVRLIVDIIPKPGKMKWIRIENDDYIMGVACCRSVEESFYAAAGEILCWMTETYGFSEEEAYLLMGQVMEARCTQFVNPTYSYICKMPKRFIEQGLH